MLRAALVTIALALALPAGASPWTIADLGHLRRAEHCLEAAERSFVELLALVEIAEIRRGAWIVYADRIAGQHDAAITCTFGEARGTRATLVIHSRALPWQAALLSRHIGHTFDGQNARLTEAWLADALGH